MKSSRGSHPTTTAAVASVNRFALLGADDETDPLPGSVPTSTTRTPILSGPPPLSQERAPLSLGRAPTDLARAPTDLTRAPISRFVLGNSSLKPEPIKKVPNVKNPAEFPELGEPSHPKTLRVAGGSWGAPREHTLSVLMEAEERALEREEYERQEAEAMREYERLDRLDREAACREAQRHRDYLTSEPFDTSAVASAGAGDGAPPRRSRGGPVLISDDDGWTNVAHREPRPPREEDDGDGEGDSESASVDSDDAWKASREMRLEGEDADKFDKDAYDAHAFAPTGRFDRRTDLQMKGL